MSRLSSTPLAALVVLGTLGAAPCALAADAPATAQPTFVALRGDAPRAKPTLDQPMPAPLAYEMRGTLMADGTVEVDCVDVPNPEFAEYQREHGRRSNEAR